MLWMPFKYDTLAAGAEVREPAILADGLTLKVGYEVGEWIGARVIVVLILPRETAEGEHGVRIDQARPARREINVLILDR